MALSPALEAVLAAAQADIDLLYRAVASPEPLKLAYGDDRLADLARKRFYAIRRRERNKARPDRYSHPPPIPLDALRMPLLATSSHASQRLDDATLAWPCAWVLGHEGQGVSTALLERCSGQLRIPQPGGEESLNVAAAAAVCPYGSARRRAAGGEV